VEDIERQARRLATDLDSVVENLSCILQSISALTVDTVETYRYSGRTFPASSSDQSISALTVDTVETYRYSGRTFPASSSPYLPSLWTLLRLTGTVVEPFLHPPVHICPHCGHCRDLRYSVFFMHRRRILCTLQLSLDF
jgi:hypothetical protein